MKVTFEVEKVTKFDKITYELKPEQIKKINAYATVQSLSFEEAFMRYADRIGIIFETLWDKDEVDYDYNVWDVEIEGTEEVE